MNSVTYHDTLLRINNVCLEFDSKVILRSVNAQIRDVHQEGAVRGQVVGFLGPSGIGKTQLFRIIAGLNKPTSGEVYINSTGELVKAGMVGVVAQSYPLFEHRSILGNILLGATKKYGKEAKDRAMSYLDRFGLADKATLYPAQLSGGQRQRVAIIQQLLSSEHFLLMDEPFSGLDLVNLEKVAELIAEVASLDELNTIIVITHDVTAACSVADHLWLLGRDPEVPGAYLKQEYDLIERGLCWHPEILKTTQFLEFVQEVKTVFRSL